MFPELSQLVHDFIRPKTRGDWRRLHKYTLQQFKYDTIDLKSPLFYPMYYNYIDGGFTPKFKQLKTLNYNGFNYSVIKVTDHAIILKYYFTQYYYAYDTISVVHNDIYYRNMDQITYLAGSKHYYLELLIVCLIFILGYLFTTDHCL